MGDVSQIAGPQIIPHFYFFKNGHRFFTALALTATLPATGRLGLGKAAGLSLVLAAAVVAGAAMGWAQVALGAHYPTDVLGGTASLWWEMKGSVRDFSF